MIASPRVDAAHLYDRFGPFVTIYIPAPSAMRGATDLLALRWKSLRRVLDRRGADGRDLAALDSAVAQGHTGGDTLVAVAAHGELLLREMTSVDVSRSVGFCEALPILSPLMAWRQGVTRQLLVATDRIGADLTVIVGTTPVRDTEIEGETEQVHKPHAGGLSQKRYQRHAEHTWDRNAIGVAGEVVDLADQHDVSIVHLAGDVRALGYLEAHLPPRSGSRPPRSRRDRPVERRSATGRDVTRCHAHDGAPAGVRRATRAP